MFCGASSSADGGTVGGSADGARVHTYGSRFEGLVEAGASWLSLRTGFNSVWVQVFGGDHNPVPQGRGGGAPGGLQGSRARQNSTAADVEQIVDFPARRGLPDFLTGQGSTASSSSRLLTMQMKEFNGFFALFRVQKKCEVGLALGVGTECGLYSVHAGELVWTLMGRRRWMMRMGTRGGSRVLVGGACSAVIVLFGGMLQGDEVACCFQLVWSRLCDHAAAVPAVRRVLRASGSVPRQNGGHSSCMQILVRTVHTLIVFHCYFSCRGQS